MAKRNNKTNQPNRSGNNGSSGRPSPNFNMASVIKPAGSNLQDPAGLLAQIESLKAENKTLKQDLEQTRNEKRELEVAVENELEPLIQARRTAAEATIEGMLSEAHAGAAEIRMRAEKEADAVVVAARLEADRLAEEIRGERTGLEAERERLKEEAQADAAQEIVQRQLKVEQWERDLKQRERKVAQKEEELTDREEDLKFEQSRLQNLRTRLDERWSTCSPERVRELEHEVEMFRGYNEADKRIIAQLQAQQAGDYNVRAITGGRTIETLVSELDFARSRIQELEDQLATYPSVFELQALKVRAQEVERLQEQCESLGRRWQEANDRGARLEISNREIEQVKVQADAVRVLNDELRKELSQHKDALESRSGARFPALLQIDAEQDGEPTLAGSRWTGNLGQLVSYVQRYAARRTPQLFYSLTTVRAFVAGLATSRLLILQGLSGTGKTSLPRVFMDAVGGHYESIPVQSGWRDRHELLGYYNDFSKKFTESEFTKAVYRAGRPTQKDVIWAIVLDEMNLARVEYYFADFLSILEETDRQRWLVSLMSSDPGLPGETRPQYLDQGCLLRIPENVWFIGTANRDESTFEITDKVYDRAQIIEFRDRQLAFDTEQEDTRLYVRRKDLQAAFDKAQGGIGKLNSEDLNYIEFLDELLRQDFGITFGNRIKRQLEIFVPVFVAAGGRKDEAIDFQLAHKVLRKVEGQHDHNLTSKLKTLSKEIAANTPSTWGEMPCSQAVVQNNIRRMGG